MVAKKKSKNEINQEFNVYKEFNDLLVALAQQSYESSGEVTSSMQISIRKLANVGALVAFGAALLGNAIFGHAGLELVAAGLALHTGADLLEDILAD